MNLNIFKISLIISSFLLTSCTGEDSLVSSFSPSSSTSEIRYNDEIYNYDIKVRNITNRLNKDFQYGVDLSSIIQVEEAGGVFYDKGGKEEDIFKILNDNGVNSIRMRLWNDPKDNEGHYYGAGHNDLETDLKIMERAKKYDMSILLDFHYSDFWADPKNQQLPKSFIDSKDLVKDIYEYTKDSLLYFKNHGINIEYIQMGNEINNGLLFDYGKIDFKNYDECLNRISSLLLASSKACKEIYPNCKTIVHLANGDNSKAINRYMTKLTENRVNYDILGITAYPFWSEDFKNTLNTLNNFVNKFFKDIMVVETSHAYTLESHEHSTPVFNETMSKQTNYEVSYEGQKEMLVDLIDILSKVNFNSALGIYYWEPAWLPLEGADAGNKYVASYRDMKDESKFPWKAGWSNQALFSYTGKMLPSLQTYKKIQDQFK